LIPGNEPAAWLNTVTRWGLGTETLRFLVIRRDDAARSIEGTLVIGRGIPTHRNEIEELATQHAADVSVLPICYRCIADRLYLPVDAELAPHVTEMELRSLLPSSSTHLLVWHPSAGLIEFQTDQIPSVVDLLTTPQITQTRWDGAQIAETLNDRIRSLNPQASQDLQDIIQQGQGDIGLDVGNIDDAPRSPDEVANPKLNDMIRNVKQWIARKILGNGGKRGSQGTNKSPGGNAPGASKPPGWIQRWAAGVLGGMAAAAGGASRGLQNALSNLSSQRENELKRLLNLLEKDPDAGLRYALPFGGNAPRGAATPSGRLGERTPDFNIRNMSGSGRADMWDVPWEYQQKLMQRYRDLAQREMRLGNHRRAAYIYATLLNDLHSAATALEAGGLFHDAAILHDKHLRNWMKAAECYRKGGFWEEALAIFRTRERWIDAGELLLKMDQPDEARLMFSNEIRSCEVRKDFLRAGELADQRLNDYEQAAALLAKGWSLSDRPEQCFHALMELHGRRGQHVQARHALQTLAGGGNVAVHQLENAVKVCSETATNYPDAAVRDVARQQTWAHASTALSRPYGDQHSAALVAIRSLSKSDELLQDDSRRFAFAARQAREREVRSEKKKQRTNAAGRKANVPQIGLTGTASLLARLMPHEVRWQSGVSAAGHCFLLTANTDRAMVGWFKLPKNITFGIVEGPWKLLQSTSEVSFERCQLLANSVTPGRVFLQQFPATSSWNQRAIECLNNDQKFVEILKPQCNLLLDFIQLPTGITWALFIDAKGKLVLESMGADSLVRQSILLDIKVVSPADNDVFRLHHDGTRAYIQTGQSIWRIDPVDLEFVSNGGQLTTQPLRIVEFPEMPQSMVASPANTTPRLAFSFQNGAQAVWPLSGDTCAFAQDMTSPRLISTGNGLVVAACASNRRIECYRLNAGRAELVAELNRESTSDEVISLMSGNAPNEFLLLHESGLLESFQIPVR